VELHARFDRRSQSGCRRQRGGAGEESNAEEVHGNRPSPGWRTAGSTFSPQLGPIAVRYTYRNDDGELVLYVCRFEPNQTWEANYTNAPKGKIEKPDNKTFRPLSFCEFKDGSTRWHWIAPAFGIPLYKADKLAANPTARVLVCEGEKAARAAQQLFPDRMAITWHGGAKAVHKAPWATLVGRQVLVWPDHDNAAPSNLEIDRATRLAMDAKDGLMAGRWCIIER
jgi:hypothetical protein